MESKEQTTLHIDQATANQLMAFSRKWKTPYLKSLQLMLDFFKRNGISPTEDLRPNMKSLEDRMGQLVGSLTAVIRNIERTQTRPTYNMMQQLFQAMPPKRTRLVEKRLVEKKDTSDRHSSHTQYQEPIKKIDPESLETLQRIFRRADIYPNGTGGKHLDLNLSASEFQELQMILKLDDHGN